MIPIWSHWNFSCQRSKAVDGLNFTFEKSALSKLIKSCDLTVQYVLVTKDYEGILQSLSYALGG